VKCGEDVALNGLLVKFRQREKLRAHIFTAILTSKVRMSAKFSSETLAASKISTNSFFQMLFRSDNFRLAMRKRTQRIAACTGRGEHGT
jgi:hypothetical protein